MPIITGYPASAIDIVSGTADLPTGFAPGTLIATPEGEVAVEALQIGQLVETLDHGPQPLRWVGVLRAEGGGRNHMDRPVMIAQGSLGGGLPRRNLVVSPQHHVLLGGLAVSTMFNAPQVLAPARGLAGMAGVRRIGGRRSIDYHALLFDRHQVIFAEGAPTESLRPGAPARPLITRRQAGDWVTRQGQRRAEEHRRWFTDEVAELWEADRDRDAAEAGAVATPKSRKQRPF